MVSLAPALLAGAVELVVLPTRPALELTTTPFLVADEVTLVAVAVGVLVGGTGVLVLVGGIGVLVLVGVAVGAVHLAVKRSLAELLETRIVM